MFQEKTIWKWLRQDTPKDLFLQRVECKFPSGFPDVMAVWRSEVIFLELKRRTKTGKINLSPQQKVFLIKLNRYGARAYVMSADVSKLIKVSLITDELLEHNKVFTSYYEWPDGKINWSQFYHLFN